MEGDYECYCSNGDLNSRGNFINNKMYGYWEFCYTNNGLKEIGYFIYE